MRSVLLGALCISCSTSWAQSGTANLSWTPPTLNTDGSPLVDLASYRVSWACGTSPAQILSIPSPASTHQLSGLPDGVTCRFMVAAVNAAGVVSAWSNEATKVMPGGLAPPADPTQPVVITWTQSTEPPPPTGNARVTLNPTSYSQGGYSTIIWDGQGNCQKTSSPPYSVWDSTPGDEGGRSVAPNVTTVFTLTCQSGTASATLTVN